MQICLSLLKEPMLEEAIRAGDCLAMLVEYFHGTGRMQEAYTHLKDMESRNIALHPYVDAQILEEVFKAVGVKDNGGGGGSKTNKQASNSSSSGDRGRDKHQDSNNDGIDSDIEEDMGDSPVPARSKNGGNNNNNSNSNSRAQPSQSNERKAPPVSNKNDSRRGSVNNRRDEEELDEDVDEVGERKDNISNSTFSLNFFYMVIQ